VGVVVTLAAEGTIGLGEVSGAVMIPGDRLVVVSDENGLGVVTDALSSLVRGSLQVQSIATDRIDDLKDVT